MDNIRPKTWVINDTSARKNKLANFLKKKCGAWIFESMFFKNIQGTRFSTLLSRVCLKPDGTRWCTGGEVKGKLANGVGSQYSHTTSEHGVSSITNADEHTSAASSRLNWRPRRFKWTRPFLRKTKSGFWACAITFQTQSTTFIQKTIYFGYNDSASHLFQHNFPRRWLFWQFYHLLVLERAIPLRFQVAT
jgi:hypothetical protein